MGAKLSRDNVVVVEDSRLSCFSAVDGELKWSTALGGRLSDDIVSNSPVIVGDTIVVPTYNPTAYSIETGQLKWVADFFFSDYQIASGQDSVFFLAQYDGASERYIIEVDVESGNPLQRHKVDVNPISRFSVRLHNGPVAVIEIPELGVFDCDTGEVLWSFDHGIGQLQFEQIKYTTVFENDVFFVQGRNQFGCASLDWDGEVVPLSPLEKEREAQRLLGEALLHSNEQEEIGGPSLGRSVLLKHFRRIVSEFPKTETAKEISNKLRELEMQVDQDREKSVDRLNRMIERL